MQYDDPTIVPGNDRGASSDIEHSRSLNNEHEAIHVFEKAKLRLLDVNCWHRIGKTGGVIFQLTDENGVEVFRNVELGDHFKISIPAPGSITGGGFDWVQVEAISQTKDEMGEQVSIRVRPTNDPQKNTEAIAHFFSDEASSTFSVRRKGSIVYALVQGRNEIPNTKTGNILDTIRNTVIATGAMLGLNKPQWKNLVEALLI